MENTTSARKSSLGWRILRWGLIGLAGLVTLVALLWTEENWRGKRAWQNYKREWEARGEKFDLKAFIPPPAPDAENFAMTPSLAPLFDFKPNWKPNESRWRDTNAFLKVNDFGSDMGWPKNSGARAGAQRMDLTAWAVALDGKKDVPPSNESAAERAASAKLVLAKMKKYDPVLEELRAASHRRNSRFNISYYDENPAGILLPHLAKVKKLSLMYQLKASAELAAGQEKAALDDIEMGFYLSESIRTEPFLISGLVQIAIINIALEPVREGLEDRHWSEAQLEELQQQLAKIDLLRDYEATMRGERALNITDLDYLRKTGGYETLFSEPKAEQGPPPLMPGAAYYQNQLAIARMYEKVILPAMDAGNHRVFVELATNRQADFEKKMKDGFVVYNIFARMLLPAIAKAEIKFAYAQAKVDEAGLACALERYRLAHGQFPETLDALSPRFIGKLPPDVITGEPLKYRRTNDGQFILYSVGWNGTDDGGTVVMGKGSTPPVDINQGDWVWQRPGKIDE